MRHRFESLTFARLATALFFLALVLAACLMPAQSDTWWQLRTGQIIWATKSIDLRDHFSHTTAGGYWPNHEWLSQVLFYGLYQLGGMRLLTAAAAALVVGAWVLVWRLMPGRINRRLIVASIAVVPASLAWSLRPQVFTFFLLAATIVLLAERRYWWLPPLFVLWANLHGGVTLGIALVMASLVAQTLHDRRLPVRALAAAACCIVATLLTPLGLWLWAEVFASLGRLRAYRVIEWRPPALADPTYLPFWILAAILAALALLERPWRAQARCCTPAVWAALAMLPLAVGSGRNVPSFALLAAPAIAMLLESRFPVRERPSSRVEHPGPNTTILTTSAAAVMMTIVYAWSQEIPRLQWHPLPDEAAAAIERCPGQLYNRYDEGGYLIWFVPDRKVFMDSRQDPYPQNLVLEQIRAETSGEYKGLFDRYDVHCAFIPRDSLIAGRLIANGWKTSYRDADWVVLAHR